MIRGLTILLTACSGIAFFFAIIGVFGLDTAIGSLASFILGAIGLIRTTSEHQL
jgi:hypothetical protein